MRVDGAGISNVPANLPEHLRQPVVYLDDIGAPLPARQLDAYRSFVDYYRELHRWVADHAPGVVTDDVVRALDTGLAKFILSA